MTGVSLINEQTRPVSGRYISLFILFFREWKGKRYDLHHRSKEYVPCCKGRVSRPCPIPEEGKWVQAKEIYRYLRLYPWHRLVCSSAGRMQADP